MKANKKINPEFKFELDEKVIIKDAYIGHDPIVRLITHRKWELTEELRTYAEPPHRPYVVSHAVISYACGHVYRLEQELEPCDQTLEVSRDFY